MGIRSARVRCSQVHPCLLVFRAGLHIASLFPSLSPAGVIPMRNGMVRKKDPGVIAVYAALAPFVVFILLLTLLSVFSDEGSDPSFTPATTTNTPPHAPDDGAGGSESPSREVPEAVVADEGTSRDDGGDGRERATPEPEPEPEPEDEQDPVVVTDPDPEPEPEPETQPAATGGRVAVDPGVDVPDGSGPMPVVPVGGGHA